MAEDQRQLESTPARFRYRFLIDSAIEKKEDDSFGIHSAYAQLLLDIITSCSTPFSIALYGGWGSGKTSVVKILESLVTAEDKVRVIYLDVWKYSSDPLKRWILFETVRQLQDCKLLNDYKFDGRSLQSHLEFDEQTQDSNKIKLDFSAIWKLLAGAGVSTMLVVLAVLFFPGSFRNSTLQGLLVVIAGSTWLLVALGAAFSEILKTLGAMVFTRTVRHVTKKPAFSSEKFGEIFKDVVQKATTADTNRLLFVFDNLDRCSDEVAVETVSVIKTFLDETSCVYLIPCDESALLRHISTTFKSETSKDNGTARTYSREFLAKFFQTVIRLPSAEEFDLTDYLDKQLRLAGVDLPAEARDVLVFGYRGQTPRQIKRVLNDFLAYSAAAERIENAGLVEKGALLGDKALLAKFSVLSVKWPNFLDKLAMDAGLWEEARQNPEKVAETDSDLARFLRATRNVSRSADVRAFIFLKRLGTEKDTVLNQKLEVILQEGNRKEFDSLLTTYRSPEQMQQIAQKASLLSRQWLDANRNQFLKNSAPLFTSLANAMKENRQLKTSALDVAERVAGLTTPEDFEAVFDVESLLSVDDENRTTQKRNLIAYISELFRPELSLLGERLTTWKALLAHSATLSTSERTKLAQNLSGKYELGGARTQEAIQMLSIGSEDADALGWLITGNLANAIALHVDFDNSESDNHRLEILIKFQEHVPVEAFRTLFFTMATQIDYAKRPSADSVSAKILEVIPLIKQTRFTATDVGVLCDALVDQVEKQTSLDLKAVWTVPLLQLRNLMKERQVQSLEAVLASAIGQPPAPTELPSFAQQLGAFYLPHLFDVNGVPQAIGAQAQYLERQFGLPIASSFREAFLLQIPANLLLNHPSCFSSREWDSILKLQTIRRALEEGMDKDAVRSQISGFIQDNIQKSLPAAEKLYALVYEFVIEKELINDDIGERLLACANDLCDTSYKQHYPEFRTVLKAVPSSIRVSAVRSLSEKHIFIKDGAWVEMLRLVASDVHSDPHLQGDSRLVYDLMDISIAAALESPDSSEGIISDLMPHLSSEDGHKLVDRALDVLIAHEIDGKTRAEIRPFMRIVEVCNVDLNESELNRIITFAQRMLGVGKSEESKYAALEFVSRLRAKDNLVASIRAEVERLTEGDSDLSRLARSLLQ